MIISSISKSITYFKDTNLKQIVNDVITLGPILIFAIFLVGFSVYSIIVVASK